jgi:hypothetical protein
MPALKSLSTKYSPNLIIRQSLAIPLSRRRIEQLSEAYRSEHADEIKKKIETAVADATRKEKMLAEAEAARDAAAAIVLKEKALAAAAAGLTGATYSAPSERSARPPEYVAVDGTPPDASTVSAAPCMVVLMTGITRPQVVGGFGAESFR